MVSTSKETSKETNNKHTVKINPRNTELQMIEIKTYKTQYDFITVNPVKDTKSKVKTHDYSESVSNTLNKLVGKTHICYLICMAIKNKKVKKKQKR